MYAPLVAIAGIALWSVVYESGVHATIAGCGDGVAHAGAADPDRNTGRRNYVGIGVAVRSFGRRAPSVDEPPHRAGVRSRQQMPSTCRPMPSPSLRRCSREWPSRSSSASWSASCRSAGSLSASGSAVSQTVFDGGHLGVAAVAGIGFTVSLFITDLAFDSRAVQDDAKIGILAASIVAATTGATVLVVTARRTRRDPTAAAIGSRGRVASGVSADLAGNRLAPGDTRGSEAEGEGDRREQERRLGL